MLLAAALLAAPADAATSGRYPVSDVLDAARVACEYVLAGDDFGEKVLKAGWVKATPKPGDWLDRTLRDARNVFGPESAPRDIYRREVGGRELFVLAVTIRDKGKSIRACTIQDPVADIDDAQNRILAWAERPPFDPGLNLSAKLMRDFNDLVFSHSWKPGLNSNSVHTIIRYVPPQFNNGDTGLLFTSERVEEAPAK